MDLPDGDVRDYGTVLTVVRENQPHTIIHLALNTHVENWQSGKADPGNRTMVENIYNAAMEAGVKRVIMASTVHTDQYPTWKGPELLSPHSNNATSPYGRNKVWMEKLGEEYAKKGLEVVCVRLGGVSPNNEVFDEPGGREVYLHHDDLVDLVNRILEADTIPDNYVVMYAVSDDEGRLHDISNPFDWKPQHGK